MPPTTSIPAAPFLKVSAVHDESGGFLTVFALNRSLTEEMPLRVEANGFTGLAVERAIQLRDGDLEAVNTKSQPDRVAPSVLAGVRVEGGALQATLAPASWNVIRLKVSRSR